MNWKFLPPPIRGSDLVEVVVSVLVVLAVVAVVVVGVVVVVMVMVVVVSVDGFITGCETNPGVRYAKHDFLWCMSPQCL